MKSKQHRTNTKEGIAVIAAERRRQKRVERFTAERDDEYVNSELASAAAAYSLPEHARSVVLAGTEIPSCWPWDQKWWKPTSDDRVRELAKAGALIAAEIDRLNRLQRKKRT